MLVVGACLQRTLERYKTFRRWQKLDREFYDDKTDKFDISKIPDIYDSLVYDLRQADAGVWLEKVSVIMCHLSI
jgi:hypothetical protein